MFIQGNPYPYPYNGELKAENTALVIIDMQTDFCGIGGYVDRMGYDISLTRRAIEPIKRLLEAARAVPGFTIIHTWEGHRSDEVVSGEVRPSLVREARRLWGVENNIYQLGHRGYVAVDGGAGDCPYTYMKDLVNEKYRLPWEDEVAVKDGSTEGFPKPARKYKNG
ncbi:MAG TPA: isochorismatase family protein [Paenibacillus sp.]|uniref:isochorismatase family protein n=1 Tax=Paenibacillus sp. TaxID=58172 RepID=UPI002C79DA70|nr:isochorismatase family protein [Paenibacillus sp.]HUC92649.1 isochorismatase family protein [Paenibacillus sp.]